MKKIHDIELDGQTGPDGKFHATGVSLVENSRDPHTGIFVDDGEKTIITVTLHPAEILNGMRENQDPMQLVLRKLQEAGAPVEETPSMRFLRVGILRRYDAFPDIKYEWRSK